MKKLFLLLMLTIIGSIAASANYRVYDVNRRVYIENYPILPQPEVSISENGSSYTITYTFDKYAILADELIPKTHYTKLKGFPECEISGMPRVPIKNETILLPDCSDYEITVVSHEKVELPLTNSPARYALKENMPNHRAFNIAPANITKNWVPISVLLPSTEQTYRGQKLLKFSVSPVQCFRQSISLSKKITIEIRFSDLTDSEISSHISPTDNVFNHVFNNASSPLRTSSLDLWTPSIIESRTLSANQKMLVITSPALEKSAKKFTVWKRKMGIDAKLVTSSEWTNDKVKATIKSWYSENKNAYYVVLFGSCDIIPPFQTSTLSDFRYTTLDESNDYTPDVYLGRITADNNDEAENIISKIISYETNPLGTLENSKIACAAYFQDEDYDTYEDRDFARTVETIYNGIGDEFGDKQRLYYCHDNVTPKYWNPERFDGSEIPTVLQDKSIWNCNSAQIVNTINSGVNLLLHRGHGKIQGWAQPYFRISTIDSLANQIYPIVLSLNCESGKFNDIDCFAKKLLNSKHGCVSVICATIDSYSFRNDAIAIGLMDSAFPHKGLKYENYKTQESQSITNNPVLTLGEMFVSGMMYMANHYGLDDATKKQLVMYNCLGDPSIPWVYKNGFTLADGALVVDKETSELSIITTEDSYISIYDPETDYLRRYFGNKAPLPNHLSGKAYIHITRPGYAPKTIFPNNSSYALNSSNAHIDRCSITPNHLTVSVNLDEIGTINASSCSITASAIKGSEVIYTYSTPISNTELDYSFDIPSSFDFIDISLKQDNNIIDYKRIK